MHFKGKIVLVVENERNGNREYKVLFKEKSKGK